MKELHQVTELFIDGEKIPYRIIFSKRKTTCITVHPNQSVIVRAPLRADRSDLEKWVQGRIPWINKHLQYFRKKEKIRPGNDFSSGEHHFYLGNKIPLRIQKSRTNSVSFHEDEILIRSKSDDSAFIERIFRDALKLKAKDLFMNRLKICHMKTAKYSLPFPELRLRWMKSRWGSCSIKRGITLNIRLIHLPVHLIDHVILHELCHLRVQNHGRAFYKMLSEIEAGWEKSKHTINQMAPLVMPHDNC